MESIFPLYRKTPKNICTHVANFGCDMEGIIRSIQSDIDLRDAIFPGLKYIFSFVTNIHI